MSVKELSKETGHSIVIQTQDLVITIYISEEWNSGLIVSKLVYWSWFLHNPHMQRLYTHTHKIIQTHQLCVCVCKHYTDHFHGREESTFTILGSQR